MKTASTGVASAIGSTSRTSLGPCRQGGLTLVGWLLVLIVAAFVALMALRIAPVYLESMTVASVVRDVARDPELRGAAPREVRTALSRRMRVNNVDSVSSDDVEIGRSGDSIRIVLAYERRFPLIANLDGVASFREEAMIEP